MTNKTNKEEIKELLREIIKDLDVIAFSIDNNKLGNQEIKERLYFAVIGKANKYKELLK